MHPAIDAVLNKWYFGLLNAAEGKLLPSEAAQQVGEMFGVTAGDVILAMSREIIHQPST